MSASFRTAQSGDSKGFQAALMRATQLEKTHASFHLLPQQDLPQGKNNRVLACTYDHQPAVLKFFSDDINRPDSRIRKGTEAFALRHFSGLAFVPRLFLETDDVLVIERFDGTALSQEIRACQNDVARNTLLESVGYDLGLAYGALNDRNISAHCLAAFRDNFHQGRSLAERMGALLDEAQRLCETDTLFRPHVDTLEMIRSSAPSVFEESPILYKYDNNFDNLLIRNARLRGLIDFEMSYLGTETIALGAMLDSIAEIYPEFPHRPQWLSLSAGYRKQRQRDIPPWRHILAMAAANHWYRILDTAALGRLSNFAARFVTRFQTLKELWRRDTQGQSPFDGA